MHLRLNLRMERFYLKGVVSRKKQLIPPLMEAAQMIGSDYV